MSEKRFYFLLSPSGSHVRACPSGLGPLTSLSEAQVDEGLGATQVPAAPFPVLLPPAHFPLLASIVYYKVTRFRNRKGAGELRPQSRASFLHYNYLCVCKGGKMGRWDVCSTFSKQYILFLFFYGSLYVLSLCKKPYRG